MIAIRAEELGKAYKIYTKPIDSVNCDLIANRPLYLFVIFLIRRVYDFDKNLVPDLWSTGHCATP